MLHPIKPSVIIIGALLGASFTAAAWFDVAYVLPAVAKARAVLARASAHVGSSNLGFEQAAVAYFREPLSTLSREQLAELVALERAPTATPETVKRIKQLLLDRTAQVGAPAP